MKLNSKTTIFSTVMGIALLFNACKKDDSEYTPTIAALSIVNASPSASSVDFYIENQKVNTNALLFGEKIDYLRAYQGNRTTTLTASGSQTALLSKTITLQAEEYNSLYIVGKTDGLDYVLLKDDVSSPATSKAKVRFVNLSPDAPSLKLEIQGDATEFLDRTYKAFTPFKNVAAVKSTLILKDNATGEVKATLTDVDLKSGRIYTIWAKGLLIPTEYSQAISIKVTEHG